MRTRGSRPAHGPRRHSEYSLGSSGFLHCRDQALARDRQIADAHAEAVEYGVRNGRGDRAMRGFTGADRIDLGALDHLDLNLRHFGETQDRIVSPAIAGDTLTIKPHTLLQDPACRLDRAALDLVDHSVGIDGFADIDR